MDIRQLMKTMDYGAAPENAQMAWDWLKKHHFIFDLYYNGAWKKPAKGDYFATINPSTGKELANLAQGRKKDVNKAVKAARKALPTWQKIGGHQRARYLYALARQIQKHARLFAVLETMDNGKPIRESKDIDIPLVVRHFYHHVGWAQLMETEFKDYEAVGVVGQIIPWNFPLLMLAWKIAPALAMGNTVVLKPAEDTSLTALLFAEICDQINLPAGVVNIVTGDGKTGAALVKHEDVDKIAFTGSTTVGKEIRSLTAGTGKQLSLELGGKSPFIVFEDADLDAVVEGIVDAIWFNQGQVCCAGSRLLVQESIAEQLYAKLKTRMQTLRIGDALDKGMDMGAIINLKQLKNIQGWVKKGVEEGAKLWQNKDHCSIENCHYPPTLLMNVAPSSVVAQEEIFGPVLVTTTFRTAQEAIQLANNTKYGLAASIWTETLGTALEMAKAVCAGVVWVNCTNVFDAAAGFGGYRESGFGREGGREGLYEYIVPKVEKQLAVKPMHLPKQQGTIIKPSSTKIDYTAKLYIGGKECRPDAGQTEAIYAPNGAWIGDVPIGNRKDIRNAVEAAHKSVWKNKTGHQRAQVLYYIAENLSLRRDEFAYKIAQSIDVTMDMALEEVEASIERIYYYAAMADKYDGQVHETLAKYTTIAVHEPLGAMGVVCPNEAPLLGLISVLMPALSMGNHVVLLPSEKSPLITLDFCQILATSDLPAGAVNVVTGKHKDLVETLARHDDVAAVWSFGEQTLGKTVEELSIGNLKQTWVNHSGYRNWYLKEEGQGLIFLQKATQIKNIWMPYGI